MYEKCKLKRELKCDPNCNYLCANVLIKASVQLFGEARQLSGWLFSVNFNYLIACSSLFN